MPRSPYDGMWSRLMTNIDEPENEQACWNWAGKRDRLWYGRLNVYVPALGATKTVMAHVAVWVCYQTNPADANAFWRAYTEFVSSGLELDHLCVSPSCVSVDHLEPVTPSENCRRRDTRAARRVFATGLN